VSAVAVVSTFKGREGNREFIRKAGIPEQQPGPGYALRWCLYNQAVREAATICPRPRKLTFDLLTLKVVSESRVTWATSVPILVSL